MLEIRWEVSNRKGFKPEKIYLEYIPTNPYKYERVVIKDDDDSGGGGGSDVYKKFSVKWNLSLNWKKKT